jgi:hypothetical protein
LARGGEEDTLTCTVADLAVVNGYLLLCAAIGLGKQTLSSLTFAIAVVPLIVPLAIANCCWLLLFA